MIVSAVSLNSLQKHHALPLFLAYNSPSHIYIYKILLFFVFAHQDYTHLQPAIGSILWHSQLFFSRFIYLLIIYCVLASSTLLITPIKKTNIQSLYWYFTSYKCGKQYLFVLYRIQFDKIINPKPSRFLRVLVWLWHGLRLIYISTT